MKMMNKGKRESKGVKKLDKSKLLKLANDDYHNAFGPDGFMTNLKNEIERSSNETDTKS